MILSKIKPEKFLSIFLALIMLMTSIPIAASVHAADNTIQAYVESVAIKSISDGIGPFDSDDSPGNDSGANNRIIRSFDTIFYTLEYNTALLSEDPIDKAVLKAELTLPYSVDEATFDLDSMAWLDNPKLTSSATAQKLTGEMILENKDANTVIPGMGTLSVGIKVKGLTNGSIIKPKIKLWLDGSDRTASISGNYDIQVSSKPGFNLRLVKNPHVDLHGWFSDYERSSEYKEGSQRGRLQSYGITLMLENEDSEKGLKGLEFPQGEISFDFTLSEKVAIDNGAQEMDGYNPILYDYYENIAPKFTSVPGLEKQIRTGKLGKRIDYTSFSRIAHLAGPANTLSTSKPWSSVYNGGKWTITPDENEPNKYHVVVSDYKFNPDGSFPTKYNSDTEASAIKFTSNQGAFSSGHILVLMGLPDEVQDTTSIYLNVDCGPIKVKTPSTNNYNETRLGDNVLNTSLAVYPTGSISKEMRFYEKRGKTFLSSVLSSYGDSTLAQGDLFYGEGYINTRGDVGDCDSYNMLLKFDDKGIKIPNKSAISFFALSSGINIKDKVTVLYAAKPDKTGWTDMNEMNSTREDQLVYFADYEKLTEQGYVCIGVLFEGRDIDERTFTTSSAMRFQIREDAETMRTYAFVNDAKLFKDNPNFSYADEGVEYDTDQHKYNVQIPKETYKKYSSRYVKTEYDENHNIISGTHLGGYREGNSIFVTGYNVSLEKQIITPSNTSTQKSSFNMDKGERIVTYKITSDTIKNGQINEDQTTVLTVKDVLPNQLTFIEGSAKIDGVRYEPTISSEEGKTVLTFTLPRIVVGTSAAPITFSCAIGNPGSMDDVINNEDIINYASLTGDNYQAQSFALNKNEASVGFKCIKLASVSLFEQTDSVMISRGEDIVFDFTCSNNGENTLENNEVYNILPFRKDLVGSSFSGDIKLSSLLLDTSDASVFYTTDNTLRTEGIEAATTANWIEVSGSEADNGKKYISFPENTTAIKISGNLDGYKAINAKMILSPTNASAQKAGDLFVNNTYQTSTGQNKAVTSNIVKVSLYGELDITKVWDDNNNASNLRPTQVQIEVLQDGILYDTITLNANNAKDFNTWHKTITRVPMFTSFGEPYVYTIKEAVTEEMKTSYKQPEYSQNTLTVTNSLAYKDIVITKIWVDENNKYDTRPSSISVEILQNNNHYSDVTLTGNKNTWTKTVSVPIYTDTGSLATYTIKENNNENVSLYYREPSYNQESLTVTNTGVFVDIGKRHKLTLKKQILNPSNISEFNQNDEYNFFFTLLELERTFEKTSSGMKENYGDYTCKTYNLLVTNKKGSTLFDLNPGKYEINEVDNNSFVFDSFTESSSSNGVHLSHENGKYYITISSTTNNNEAIEVTATNIFTQGGTNETHENMNIFDSESLVYE